MRIFYANNLVDALFASLHIARQEFSLLVDLLDDAVESSFGNESTRTSAF